MARWLACQSIPTTGRSGCPEAQVKPAAMRGGRGRSAHVAHGRRPKHSPGPRAQRPHLAAMSAVSVTDGRAVKRYRAWPCQPRRGCSASIATRRTCGPNATGRAPVSMRRSATQCTLSLTSLRPGRVAQAGCPWASAQLQLEEQEEWTLSVIHAAAQQLSRLRGSDPDLLENARRTP